MTEDEKVKMAERELEKSKNHGTCMVSQQSHCEELLF